MIEEECGFPLLALLRQQTWLSPAFPTGAYSYSHGLEWAVQAGHIHDRETLVDWLETDLCYGSGRNEAIFFNQTWRSASEDDLSRLLRVAELAAVFRSTSGFALESAQQSFIANLVNAGVRLLPLGQTDGQLALAQLEKAVLSATAETKKATLDDLGSAAFMVDLSSMAHETQYTRLFRS